MFRLVAFGDTNHNGCFPGWHICSCWNIAHHLCATLSHEITGITWRKSDLKQFIFSFTLSAYLYDKETYIKATNFVSKRYRTWITNIVYGHFDETPIICKEDKYQRNTENRSCVISFYRLRQLITTEYINGRIRPPYTIINVIKRRKNMHSQSSGCQVQIFSIHWMPPCSSWANKQYWYVYSRKLWK